MYLTQKNIIRPDHELFSYCEQMCLLANNMYNTTLFYIRQVMTGIGKETPTENEAEIINILKQYIPLLNKKYKKRKSPFQMPTPKKWMLSYTLLDALFKETKNTDYYSGMPMHGVQHSIKRACMDMKGFFKSVKEYKCHPEKFTGKPNLPHYKPSGGKSTVTFSNQECTIDNRKLKFPKCDKRLTLRPNIQGTLKQVEIKPYYSGYVILIVMDVEEEIPELQKPNRIASIDFGVDNLVAIANNAGLPGLLFKGGYVKSHNQWFNKQRAELTSVLMTNVSDDLKHTTSKKLKRLSERRTAVMDSEMGHIANQIVKWCMENKIDTLVLGHNNGWKNNVNMGHIQNQNFVQIPFARLQSILKYKCERNGIRAVEQEESYTSKSSFLDKDPIPVYQKNINKKYEFSGQRVKRGLYKSKEGKFVNADLNGAGNILRKAFPSAFDKCTTYPFFENIIVFRHNNNKKVSQ